MRATRFLLSPPRRFALSLLLRLKVPGGASPPGKRPTAFQEGTRGKWNHTPGRLIMSYDPRLLFEEISSCLRENPARTLVDISQCLRVSRRTIEKAIGMSTSGTFRAFPQEILLPSTNNLFTSQPTLTIKKHYFVVSFKSPNSFSRSIKRACGSSPFLLPLCLA